MNKRPKLLYHSCSSSLSTGFSRHGKTLLSELYKRGNIDLVEICNAPFYFPDDPRLKKLPWKSYGVLPPESVFHSLNEQQRHLAGYGQWALDEIVRIEKPNAYLGVEDAWAFPGHANRPWFKKILSILHTPVDSLPLLPLHKALAGAVSNFWVKASFAAREFSKLGFSHVKTVPALVNHEPFFPLKENERLNLRRQVGISDDTFVIGYLFRNQLRKLIGTLLDGFKLFQDKNPEAKIRLLLHTNMEESWPIPRMIAEAGINNDHILTSYVCRNCQSVQIMPYTGNEKFCPGCHKNALFNVSVDYGVSESELGQIYNLMDCLIHPATSGGFEIPLLEASFCSVPISTIEYSFGESFTSNPDVYPLKSSFYREVNSCFLKAQPYVESVSDAIGHFYFKSREERKEIGDRMRSWALEKFDYKKWIDWIEDFIIKNAVYDYAFDFADPPNTAYPFKPKDDPREFVKDLFQGVFHVDLDENHGDFVNTVTALQKGITQQQVHHDFIARAQEIIDSQNKVNIEDLVDKSGKKRLIYVVPDSKDDCINSLAVLESLFKQYEGWAFHVSTRRENFDFFSHLPVTLIEYQDWMDDPLKLEGQGPNKGFFDVAINGFLLTRKFHAFSRNGSDINQLQ